jgi:hypothetical protein
MLATHCTISDSVTQDRKCGKEQDGKGAYFLFIAGKDSAQAVLLGTVLQGV